MVTPSPTRLPDAPAPPEARALVALSGPVLTYAEVGHAGALLRLGACEFPFDAEHAVYVSGDPDALGTLSEAVAEIFAGTEAQTLLVAASPLVATTFFAPLPAALDDAARDEHLRQEASLLADVPPTHPVRIRISAMGPADLQGVPHRWYHVLHVAEPIHARVSLLAQTLRLDRYDLVATSRAAAMLVPPDPAARGLDLLVGCFASHTEVALLDGPDQLFGSHGPGHTPEDSAYFALAALQRIGRDTTQVGRLLAYGDALGPGRLAVLEGLVGSAAVLLDPLAPFSRRPAGIDAHDLAAYVPVLGAALL
jgi:hypothetical protein